MSRLVLVVACAGCALLAQRSRRAPLESEGEVWLRTELAQGAAGVAFELASAGALRGDGSVVSLEPAVSPMQPGADWVLAAGALPPGQYDGFVLGVRVSSKGVTEVRVEAPFGVSARRATVVRARLRFGQGGVEIFAAPLPATLPQRSGYCSSSDKNDLEVFDVATWRAASAVPAGSAPWGIALDPVASRAFVALSGEDQIAAIDLATGTELFRIRLSAGDEPRELLLTPDRRLLLSANAGSGTVSFVDPASMVETSRVQVGDEPVSLLLDRKLPRLYVFNQRGASVSVVDLGARAVVATLPVGTAPLRGQIDAQGTRLYVASSAASDLQVFSLPSLAPQKRIHVGLGTTALKVDAATDLLYVANGDGRVSIFDPFSLVPLDFFDLPGGASFFVIDPAQDALVALLPREIVAVQLTTKAVLGRIEVGGEPRVLALARERN